MFSGLVAGLTSAVVSVFSKLVSQAFFEAVITKVTVHLVQKLADNNKSPLTQDLASETIKRLEGG